MNLLKKAKFLTSVAKLEQMLADKGFEVAFAGRSNCGKSSLINAITEQGKLAKTSKTPGRTQMINFFELDDRNRLVDLPGYGFAKVKEDMRMYWQALIEGYLQERNSLKGVVLINDIRHPLKDSDRQMLEWSIHFKIPALVVLNKSDKLTRNQINQAIQFVRKETKGEDIDIVATSAMRKAGLEEVHDWIVERLDLSE